MRIRVNLETLDTSLNREVEIAGLPWATTETMARILNAALDAGVKEAGVIVQEEAAKRRKSDD